MSFHNTLGQTASNIVMKDEGLLQIQFLDENMNVTV